MGKVSDWIAVRTELERTIDKPRYCEIRFTQCTGGLNVYFAHSKKRGDIKKPKYVLHAASLPETVRAWEKYNKDIREVIWACNSCHNVIESWHPDKMKSFVREKLKKPRKKWIKI